MISTNSKVVLIGFSSLAFIMFLVMLLAKFSSPYLNSISINSWYEYVFTITLADKGSDWLDNQKGEAQNQGVLIWNNQVMQSLQQTGEVPVIINNNGSLVQQTIKCVGAG